jgi:hypothetical protein
MTDAEKQARYEAALREIANAEFPYHPDSVPWQAKLAREALAAAQEDIGLDLGGPPDCVDGTDNSGAVGGAAAQEGT